AFRYRDKGNLATIGRGAAVADIKGLKLSGQLAWITWLFVHLFYLIGFQNRVLVFIRWTVSFFTHGRGARLVTGQNVEDRGGAPPPPEKTRLRPRRPPSAPPLSRARSRSRSRSRRRSLPSPGQPSSGGAGP